MDRPGAGTPKDGFTVLFMGWLGARKGLPEALRAVPLVRKEVPEARFIFAGVVEKLEKELIEPLCEAAERAGGVVFPGFVAGEGKLALLSQASALILPSHAENLPVSVIEAMAMGLPVVTTPVGGVPEVVIDGHNGFLIEPGDYQALADRIVRLAKDPELRRAMGQANAAKARLLYHPALFAARMQGIYECVLTTGERVEARSRARSSPERNP
jgi:glycosyltransferase involved in cell wall biosynthesis